MNKLDRRGFLGALGIAGFIGGSLNEITNSNVETIPAKNLNDFVNNTYIELNYPYKDSKAVILETMKLHDESLELARKILDGLIVFDMVSVQPFTQPAGLIFYHENNQLESFPLSTKTRILKTRYKSDDLDSVAHDIKNEITREVIKDLRNNCDYCGLSVRCSQHGILPSLNRFRRQMIEKPSQSLWAVMSPNSAKNYGLVLNSSLCIEKFNFGKLNIIVDPLFISDEVLYGIHDSSCLLNGYTYCPYILYTVVPDSTMIMMRYAKRLHSNKHYGLLKVVE